MNYTVRSATAEDMTQVMRLIQELANFEKEGGQVLINADNLIADGFGNRPLFHCFVAETGAEIVGLALVYPRYSTWKGPALHLEDLIVTQKMRGKGVGSTLLGRVVQYAKENGARRVSWEVLDWNEAAIAFYESKGAKVLRDWDVVQLDHTGIQNYNNS